MPYYWSNPNPNHDAFILNVLNHCHLEDIVKCVNYFGFERVKSNYANVADDLVRKIAGRQLNNIEKAINELAAEKSGLAKPIQSIDY